MVNSTPERQEEDAEEREEIEGIEEVTTDMSVEQVIRGYRKNRNLAHWLNGRRKH